MSDVDDDHAGVVSFSDPLPDLSGHPPENNGPPSLTL